MIGYSMDPAPDLDVEQEVLDRLVWTSVFLELCAKLMPVFRAGVVAIFYHSLRFMRMNLHI
jgi:hypothetical protein